MESYLSFAHCDLVTPDGQMVQLDLVNPRQATALVRIEHISPVFVGYDIDPSSVFFNLKSTLAQIGIDGIGKKYFFDKEKGIAEIEVELKAYGELAQTMLSLIPIGAYIGKLFAADERRRVRDPDYLMRMFGRSDRKGRPLLSLGGLDGSRQLILEKSEGRTIAFLSLKNGIIGYEPSVYGFLPTLAKALSHHISHTRQLLHLHHKWHPDVPRIVQQNEVLLVRTAPLHIRTVYGRVVNELLPAGIQHFSASVLQPDTFESGDIYELHGESSQAIEDIPIEFYTLEHHREHVFFADRDQLLTALEDPEVLFKAFATAPQPDNYLASVFIVKGTQMQSLQEKDWILRDPFKYDFPGLSHPTRQALVAEKYVEHQPQYPFLKAIEEGWITSQGILLCRHFPTPLLKRMLLNDHVSRCLKRLYFQHPSCSYGAFFSHEDRAMLIDLAKFGIPVYWVDEISGKILQFVSKQNKEAGLFVPIHLVDTFRKATVFGVYGSNLQEGHFETELKILMEGILELKQTMIHPLLCKDTPLALLTGGGPGAMEVGNRVAKSLGILSCANIVDFRAKGAPIVNEQKQNPHIEAKMTYRLDRLVERQAEFYLDFPIFLPGGIGMDFEYTLEEVRRKTGATAANPILLFGSLDYWKRKVSSRFQLNLETGTIKGSEWISNCFYRIQTGQEGLLIYEKFANGTLKIGKEGPIYQEGFCPHVDLIREVGFE